MTCFTRKKMSKAQSAMEYLMTYGWAILIIAVVLGALFQLGVFNAGTFAPKAPPGACQVYRPEGPGTTTNINIEGICSGELPQYVAFLPPDTGSNPSYILTSNSIMNSIVATDSFTLVLWIYFKGQSVSGNWNGAISG
ncbi:MAG: hypothetical protein M1286_02610, partial [Candidatus Marsarchaeota archaeon]|nr:hypothetical protein [Candidatus Marsarchaeota archaeon]